MITGWLRRQGRLQNTPIRCTLAVVAWWAGNKKKSKYKIRSPRHYCRRLATKAVSEERQRQSAGVTHTATLHSGAVSTSAVGQIADPPPLVRCQI